MTTRRFQTLTATLVAAGALALTGTGAAAADDTGGAMNGYEAVCTQLGGEVVTVDSPPTGYSDFGCGIPVRTELRGFGLDGACKALGYDKWQLVPYTDIVACYKG